MIFRYQVLSNDEQNDPQNRQKIVTLMNNKVAAITKTMQLPGDK